MKQTRTGQQVASPTIPITRQIFQTLAITTACVVCLTGAGLLIPSVKALAFGIGGAVSLVPNAYFAMRVLLAPAPLDARVRLRQLYAAELTKLLICALLFALIFSQWRALPPAWLLTGFAVTHIGYLVLSGWLIRRSQPTVEQPGGTPTDRT